MRCGSFLTNRLCPALEMLLPLLGERAGVRENESSLVERSR